MATLNLKKHKAYSCATDCHHAGVFLHQCNLACSQTGVGTLVHSLCLPFAPKCALHECTWFDLHVLRLACATGPAMRASRSMTKTKTI